MKKNISIVSRGLVVDVGRFEKSHVEGWITIYSKVGEMIGGFDMVDNKLKVIHKHRIDDTLSITYALREVKQ